jgi:hypothetical protein
MNIQIIGFKARIRKDYISKSIIGRDSVLKASNQGCHIVASERVFLKKGVLSVTEINIL